ncbi:MAG: Gfo/Idh/MocA family oxidoreductase [Bacteroidales bacterium]|nr:Gfo/Idh/MocA family oxidoreductase [Bacteroidales bacterium]
MIRLGVIGMSPGNAHPYSWSAIINGCFDRGEIVGAGYPAVSAYLEANRDTLGLPGAEVTHIWTQERQLSESIAKSSGINFICTTIKQMAGSVDAVLLSRDDPENHVAMAMPFIESGIPVFIDKPLATNRKDLAWFSKKHQDGALIMSGSSMRYSFECRSVKQELASLGKIELVTAAGKKDWIKYGVHMIEAIAALLDDPKPVSVQNTGKKDKASVHIEYDNGVTAIINIFMNISSTFQISVYGQNGWRLAEIKNSYSMFRENIMEFLRSVQEGRSRLSFEKTENIVLTLIAGKESLEKGGTTILLKG